MDVMESGCGNSVIGEVDVFYCFVFLESSEYCFVLEEGFFGCFSILIYCDVEEEGCLG